MCHAENSYNCTCIHKLLRIYYTTGTHGHNIIPQKNTSKIHALEQTTIETADGKRKKKRNRNSNQNLTQKIMIHTHFPRSSSIYSLGHMAIPKNIRPIILVFHHRYHPPYQISKTKQAARLSYRRCEPCQTQAIPSEL